MNLFTIFITGLFAGGMTCLAMQGGLLATSIAQQEEEKLQDEVGKTHHIVPVLSFLATRLITYTLLGLFLGLLGSVVQLSLHARIILQVGVVIFMIGTALNLLQVHPVFRYFVIHPPRSLLRLVKNQSKSTSIFGPALLGAFTVLIPCGATQAMMAYAVSVGSPLSGAATMFAFILGTSPLFFLLGYVAKKLHNTFSARFNTISAIAILLIALYNLNGALVLSGSTFTIENLFQRNKLNIINDATHIVDRGTIYFTQSGYKTDPAVITVKGGSRVTLQLVNTDGAGCIQAFTIPLFNIQRMVAVGMKDEIVFTAPNVSGIIPFMCSMGMYKGVIHVI